MTSRRDRVPTRRAGPPPPVPWSAGVGVGGWVLSMAALLVVAPILIGIAAAAGADFEDIGVWLIPLAPIVTGVVALLVAAVTSGGSAGQLLGRAAVRPGGLIAALWLGVVAFIAFNILLGAIVVYTLQLLGIEPPEVQQTLRDAAARPEALPILVLSTTIAAPIGEELLYRGLLFQGLLRRFRPAAAIWLSALAFAVGHVTLGAPVLSNVVLALLILPLGAILAWAFYRWGTLWVPILIHAVFNGITVGLMTSGLV